MEVQTEILVKEKHLLGESPFYDPRSKTFTWVDILRGEFWRLSETGEKTCFALGQPVGAAVPAGKKNAEKAFSYVLAAKDGLYLWQKDEASLLYALIDIYQDWQRSNDAKADPAGRLWFGSSCADDDHAPAGNLYRYEGNEAVLMQAGTKIANGMAWSSDRKSFYFADSEEHAVFVYDYDLWTGNIKNRRVLFTVENGVPDGMCIDTEDNLWLAVWGGSRVEKRSGRTGELLDVISLPAVQVTSCCFGGEKMDMLYITSAATGLTGEADGCVFRCRVGARGKAPDYFKVDPYRFYGWQEALVPARTDGFPGVDTPREMYDILSGIWCAATCAPRMRDEWKADNPTFGQCSITAFLVQDIFGGEVRGILRPGGNYHCYNVVDGHVFDLTSEQFGDEILDYRDNPIQLREVHFAKEEKRQRYFILKEKLREYCERNSISAHRMKTGIGRKNGGVGALPDRPEPCGAGGSARSR